MGSRDASCNFKNFGTADLNISVMLVVIWHESFLDRRQGLIINPITTRKPMFPNFTRKWHKKPFHCKAEHLYDAVKSGCRERKISHTLHLVEQLGKMWTTNHHFYSSLLSNAPTALGSAPLSWLPVASHFHWCNETNIKWSISKSFIIEYMKVLDHHVQIQSRYHWKQLTVYIPWSFIYTKSTYEDACLRLL